MTDAARLACQWGFDALGLGRIEWWATVGNDASRRVAEKLGFTFEGTCRARLLHRGVRVDGWVGGLLPGELR
jgi:RimJ/RimL family protein N-acetyltransferase